MPVEKIGAHTYRLHINDTAVFHPGGTNIYFIGDPKDEMVLIDTGEQDREWVRLILEAYRELSVPRITAILITHGHSDHIGGLDRIRDVINAPVRCHPKLVDKLTPYLGKEAVGPFANRERIATGGGVVLEAQFTPGHAEDHVCFFLHAEKIAFTGDTILGSSTSVVSDLYSYMKSLHLVQKFTPAIICPAHGKVVTEAPQWVEGYIKHRNMRERQVLSAVQRGVGDVDEIVRLIYPKTLKKELKRAAAGNVRQHLAKLVKEGAVKEQPARYAVSA
jgi:glyoxylase-like metal-dependent hydrolase (beta-lactamase superfamily II)